MTGPLKTIGVLALQGDFLEHMNLCTAALVSLGSTESANVSVISVKTPGELARCTGLIIPGGESTAIALVAEQTGLLEPLREFSRNTNKAVWGTCAGLILLSQQATARKLTGRDSPGEPGQQLIGGLDVRVRRNHFGRQTQSFLQAIDIPEAFGKGANPLECVFIRAPIVEAVNVTSKDLPEDPGQGDILVTAPPLAKETALSSPVRILASLPPNPKLGRDEDLIVAVAQGDNLLGTSFHPEMTQDTRLHEWWIKTMVLPKP